MDSIQLNKWLPIFITKTRKVNGEAYPPTTLQQLLSGLQRYMRSINYAKAPISLRKIIPSFVNLHRTMDSVYRNLRCSGIGAESRQTETFSKEEERQLWDSGVLGTDNPLSLLCAVFFNNGKMFCLRGGDEHRHLKLYQFQQTGSGYISLKMPQKIDLVGLHRFTSKTSGPD